MNAPTTEAFVSSWSSYIDQFLARRSVLHSSLFPEKPAQQAFGYEYCSAVLPEMTRWVSSRWAPADLGRSLQRLGADASGVHIAGVLWTYALSSLQRSLAGDRPPNDEIHEVFGFWAAAWSALLGGELRDLWPDGPLADRCFVLDSTAQAEVFRSLHTEETQRIGSLVGALTNYCWLLECESRQGVFNHGLYASAGERHSVLVRSFHDLQGATYDWAPDIATSLPSGTISVSIASPGVRASFDALGVVSVAPEDYAESATAWSVHMGRESVSDLHTWVEGTLLDVKASHRALYRVIASWNTEQRLLAGVTSYAKMWRALLVEAGADEPTLVRLVDQPLAEHLDKRLAAAALEAASPQPLWTWIGEPTRPTVLAPLLEGIAS